MMMPWSSQAMPTSEPEAIMGKGMCRVHFFLKASMMPSTGNENRQYMMAVRMRPKRVLIFSGSSNCVRRESKSQRRCRLGRIHLTDLWVDNHNDDERCRSENHHQMAELVLRRYVPIIYCDVNQWNGKSHEIRLKCRIVVKYLTEANVETRAASINKSESEALMKFSAPKSP